MMTEHLDRWVSEWIRNEIEQRYYAKVSERATFDRLAVDPDFMAAPNKHVGLFADHGVVHARDVSTHLLGVLASCNGVLIPRRNPHRFALMQGYGVLLAYFHDIGMSDFSKFGRAMHPEFAAQAVFDPDLDDVINAIWHENSGGLAWHLHTLADLGLLEQDPMTVLRELLSLSICHSKSKVPVELLNDPVRLRSTLVEVIATDLECLYEEQRVAKARQELAKASVEERDEWSQELTSAEAILSTYDAARRHNPNVDRFYRRPADEAFCWLLSDEAALQELVADAIDTLRALRCADALRQRGTALATSAGYEIFVDHRSGSAVYALRLGRDQLHLLEMSDPISAGEANIASSELDPAGDLRISFHRGDFSGPGAQEHAAYSAAHVIHDIQSDVIESFLRTTGSGPAGDQGLKPASEMEILLEDTDDALTFIEMVKNKLAEMDSRVSARVRLVPSLKEAHPLERERYLAAETLGWGPESRRNLLAKMSQAGHPVEKIDVERAFESVHVAALSAGDVLIEAGAPSVFVYVPLGPGLKIIPLGGYQSFLVKPWMLLGLTGVVRDAERNATVMAEQAVRVLIIPKMPYMKYWHHTLSLEAFQAAVADALADAPAEAGSLSQLDRKILLQNVPMFSALGPAVLAELSAKAVEVRIAAGEVLFEQGAIGHSLFVVVEGALHIHNGELILGHVGPGDVLGEMAAITPEPRMASVTADEDSLLLSLDRRALTDLMETDPAVARGVIEVLAQYVRSMASDLTQQQGHVEE
jgi:hypothetical protein